MTAYVVCFSNICYIGICSYVTNTCVILVQCTVFCSLTDSVKSVKLSDVQFGLQSGTNQKVPLESVHVRAKLKDLAAQVCVKCKLV